LRITAVGSAEHGEVRLDEGSVMFRPERDYHGNASFSYTVTDASGLSTTGRTYLRIDPVTDAPLVADETIAATEDQPLIIDTALLLSNDIDTDILLGEAQTLSVVAIDQLEGGTARLRDGQIVFTPEANRIGQAGFRYTVSDGAGGLAQGMTTITLAPVNDAPLVPALHGQTEEEQPLAIPMAELMSHASDVDDDHSSLRFAGIGHVGGGSVTVHDGQLIFTPTKDYAGAAMIEYQIADTPSISATSMMRPGGWKACILRRWPMRIRRSGWPSRRSCSCSLTVMVMHLRCCLTPSRRWLRAIACDSTRSAGSWCFERRRMHMASALCRLQ
jgi:hypothetical protein